MENKQSDSDDPLKYCGGGSKESLITGENLDINTEDVILIFLEDENGEIKVAQCMLRQEIKTMYKQVNNKRDENRQLKGIRIKPDDTLVIKLPHIGVFVSNVEIIFQGDYSKDAVFIGKLLRPTDSQKTHTLNYHFNDIRDRNRKFRHYSELSSQEKAVVDTQIYVKSPFGVGNVHEPHFVYRIEPADPENPIVKEITAIMYPRPDFPAEEEDEEDEDDDKSGTIQIDDITYKRVGLISKLREIQNQVVSTISIYNYKSISRIDYLPNTLTTLNLKNLNNLTSLPALPEGLTSLIITNCKKLPILPDLPAGLTTLSLTDTSVTSLPALPEGLTSLELPYLPRLTSLPALPAGLTTLVMDLPKLTSLPALPEGLTSLQLSDLPKLTSLPALPEGLTSLIITNCNRLTSLPALPEGLTSLELPDLPRLTSLPALPEGLTSLELSDLPILTSLPALPEGLTSLIITNCKRLTSLPDLPEGLTSLELSDLPRLTSLPVLPEGLIEVSVTDLPGVFGD